MATLPRWRRPARLFSDFNTLPFARVVSMLVFIILLFFMTAPTHHHSTSYDLAKVNHPVPMPGADRERCNKNGCHARRPSLLWDRPGKSADLPQKIVDHLKDHGMEPKVYIVADMRPRWGSIKPVLDGTRGAGVWRIAFLVDQRRTTPHIWAGSAYSLARFLIQMGVPINPNAARIWFSKKR
jgi:biopolymer transport protein ExbD